MYIPGPIPEFDIRRIIPGSEFDNDHLQARYDTVNRMVLLVGDIPFDKLFTESWETLLADIDGKVIKATAYGLLRYRPDLPGHDVLSCFKHLREQQGNLRWQEFVTTGYKRRDEARDKSLDTLYEMHIALWQQGIYLPNPQSCTADTLALGEAIKTVIAHAGSRTYKGYWDRLMPEEKCDWSKEEIRAVHSAMKAGALFDPCPNDRCCITDEGCDNIAAHKCCFGCDEYDDQCVKAVPE